MSRPPGFFTRLRQRFVSTPRSNSESEALRNAARHREALQIESGLLAAITRYAREADVDNEEKNAAALAYIQYIRDHRGFLVHNGYAELIILTLQRIVNNPDIENDIHEMAREEIEALRNIQPPFGGGRRRSRQGKRRATRKARKSRRRNTRK
jgi:hypothetical protein